MKLLLKERATDAGVQLAIGIGSGLATNAITKKIANGDLKKAKLVSGGAIVLGLLGLLTDNEYAQSAGFGIASAGATNLVTSFSVEEDPTVEPSAVKKNLSMFTPLSGFGETPSEYVPQFAQIPQVIFDETPSYREPMPATQIGKIVEFA